MKSLLLIGLLLTLVFAKCESSHQETQSATVEAFEEGKAVLITDTARFANETFKSFGYDNTVDEKSRPSGYSYPPSTKEVTWYSIGYAINGSGNLTVVCADTSTYSVSIPSTAISAVSSLMQNSVVRFDTSENHRIFVYKTPLKGF